MSSLNKFSLDTVYSKFGKLADKKNRATNALEVARLIGAEELVICISDPEIHTLLPAHGFPQTLPAADKWKSFLDLCVKKKLHTGTLPFPTKTNIKSAVGIAYKDVCVFVFLGGNPDMSHIQRFRSIIPLLCSVLLFEQNAIHSQAELALAKKSYLETQFIAKKLDTVRRDLQKALQKNEEEIIIRKQKELELSNEKRRIYDLFMQAPAMISVVKGKNFIFELANPHYLKVTGKTKKIIGKSALEVFPELENHQIINILKNVYETGKPFIGTEILIKMYVKNSSVLEEKYYNFVVQPTYDIKNNIDGVMTHAIDVTTHVQARNKIEEAERKFRTLADNVPNLMWMANADGYIYWYNSRWYEYTGTTPKEMEGWGWQSTHDPNVLPIVLKKWTSSIKSGKPFDMVFPLKGADGIFRPFLTRIVPIHDENGKIVQWFGSNTDITEQKQLERQKDDFLGIASHELKTPVTSIKAYGQVLQIIFKRKGDHKALELITKQDAQVNKLTSLIADLLDVTKIQSGRMEFHEDYFDFNELITEQVEQLQLTTEKHTIQKKLDRTKSVYGDRERIGQVITNLISNAIKYSPLSKKIIVTTSTDKNYVTLCVKDFGIGIPNDKLQKVFEQFYRVSGSKEITFPGLGLGLYVSSEIIKREGGKIWVESIEGKGSTFCFRIPIHQKNKKTTDKSTQRKGNST